MSGGAVAGWPATVEFGILPCGRSQSRVVEIRNAARPGGAQVVSVSTDWPGMVAAEFQKPEAAGRRPAAEFEAFGQLSGFVLVHLTAPKAQEVVNAVVTVNLADREGRPLPLTIPVRAHVVPRFTFAPGEVALPR